MTPTAEQIHAGQAAFTQAALAVYDPLVLGLTCRLIWRCSTRRILQHYRQHLSANHLEVGVGTGFFLSRSKFPATSPRLALLDLNPNCLARTARCLARYAPETHRANVLEPIRIDGRGFDSIALNYVLHCLPGRFPDKGAAFLHLKQRLLPGGVLFGSTVLQGGVSHRLPARTLLRVCNARRLFSNRHDDVEGLTHALTQHLQAVRVEIVGSVALFSGRAPS